MKRFIICLIMFLYSNFAVAQDVIYTIQDGTQLKCTVTKNIGTIPEYKDQFIDYYVFRNGKLYSQNLSKMFGNPNHNPKKVLGLVVTKDKIIFKDRLYRWKACHYKWVTIDRHTGKYTFDAKKSYNWIWYFPQTYGTGTCEIIKD